MLVHSALERIGAGPASRRLPFREATAQAQKRASAMANRVLAAGCPWTAQRRGSRYRWNASSSSWLVDVESVLRAPIEVDDEVRRLRRTLFKWLTEASQGPRDATHVARRRRLRRCLSRRHPALGLRHLLLRQLALSLALPLFGLAS